MSCCIDRLVIQSRLYRFSLQLYSASELVSRILTAARVFNKLTYLLTYLLTNSFSSTVLSLLQPKSRKMNADQINQLETLSDENNLPSFITVH